MQHDSFIDPVFPYIPDLTLAVLYGKDLFLFMIGGLGFEDQRYIHFIIIQWVMKNQFEVDPPVGGEGERSGVPRAERIGIESEIESETRDALIRD